MHAMAPGGAPKPATAVMGRALLGAEVQRLPHLPNRPTGACLVDTVGDDARSWEGSSVLTVQQDLAEAQFPSAVRQGEGVRSSSVVSCRPHCPVLVRFPRS
ncbi:hypothetical protein GCM10027174_03620 [Salinifilum aidingensis]